jgi:hypothetical protein
MYWRSSVPGASRPKRSDRRILKVLTQWSPPKPPCSRHSSSNICGSPPMLRCTPPNLLLALSCAWRLMRIQSDACCPSVCTFSKKLPHRNPKPPTSHTHSHTASGSPGDGVDLHKLEDCFTQEQLIRIHPVFSVSLN